MLTYQDLEKYKEESEPVRMQFIRTAITQHQASKQYRTARTAANYAKKHNETIMNFQKMIYNAAGNAVPDTFSSNYKVGRAFFPFFITQENQYLLSNGVSWEDEETSKKLGTKKKPFDRQLMKAGREALIGGVSFGFFNLDHVDVFKITEFVPFYDETNSALRGGIRFWQIDIDKPLRATLYEEDGYTEYIWNRRFIEGRNEYIEEGAVLKEKRPYITTVKYVPVDDEYIYQGENYPSFPIVPLYANEDHQSELVGLQEQIDTFDLIKSGFCNNVEEASYVFWAIHNAGGMDDGDLSQFIKRVRTIHAAVTEDTGAEAEPKTIDTPYQGREALLERLEKDLFKDAMAFDPEQVTSGGATATQIKSAYEPLDSKANDYEYCVTDFVNGILELVGIDDTPTFTRSRIVNASEVIQTVLSAADHLSEEYVTTKVLTVLGDGDQVESVLNEMDADELGRGDVLSTNYETENEPDAENDDTNSDEQAELDEI